MITQLEPFKIITPITPEDLNKSEKLRALLYRSIGDDPFSMTIDELLDDIYNHTSILFSWNDKKGILLLSFGETMLWGKLTKVCWLTNVCTEEDGGYLKHMENIDADILSICKAQGAKWLLGNVASAALCRIYEKRGARTLHRVMREI